MTVFLISRSLLENQARPVFRAGFSRMAVPNAIMDCTRRRHLNL